MNEVVLDALKLVYFLAPPGVRTTIAVVTAAAFLLGLAVYAVGLFFQARRRTASQAAPEGVEAGLNEDLSTFPEVWSHAIPGRLTLHGSRARLRLVVVAPVGWESPKDVAEDDSIQQLLDQIVPGLGQVVQQDAARLRVWPAQSSERYFAAHFFRHTSCPDRPGMPSHWVLAAGPAHVSGKTVLVGFAIWRDDAAPMEGKIVSSDGWREFLQVEEAVEVQKALKQP